MPEREGSHVCDHRGFTRWPAPFAPASYLSRIADEARVQASSLRRHCTIGMSAEINLHRPAARGLPAGWWPTSLVDAADAAGSAPGKSHRRDSTRLPQAARWQRGPPPTTAPRRRPLAAASWPIGRATATPFSCNASQSRTSAPTRTTLRFLLLISAAFRRLRHFAGPAASRGLSECRHPRPLC